VHRFAGRWRDEDALFCSPIAWIVVSARIEPSSRAANLNTDVGVVSLSSNPAGSAKVSEDLLTERGQAHGPSAFGAF
jgi:hypothetical protein